jgi:two-component system, OmpR family, sensor kinase
MIGAGWLPASGHPVPDSDRTLTARAARRLTVRIAAAVTCAVLLVGGAAWLLVRDGQRRAVDREIAVALGRADDVTDPPDHVYLFLAAAGDGVRATPDGPAGLPDRAELAAVAATGQARTTHLDLAGREFQVQTQRHGGDVLQAAYDLTDQEQERSRLLAALSIAEGTGVGAAWLVGAVLARRAVAPLGDALARQRRFVADAAHELRTPLTLLHTRVQLLERAARQRGGDPLAAEAQAVLADSRRLREVIDDLLQAADRNRTPDRRTAVDLGRLAEDVVAAATAHAEQQGVRLALGGTPAALDRTGPGHDPAATVVGVESALRRAIAALVDNALGHTDAGGSVTVTVGRRVDRGRPMVTVQVADTGVGLDPDGASALFERFARGQETGDRRRFGLGLALVQDTIVNHHGRVEVAGQPGVGASFTLLLPAQAASDDTDPGRPTGRRVGPRRRRDTGPAAGRG